MMPAASQAPATISDPTNAAILAISEDRLAGFQLDPFGEIAARSGVGVRAQHLAGLGGVGGTED